MAVRKLAGASGVYAIRQRGFFGNVIVYVGESHTGSLRKTLTRHFQSWHRGPKKWFVGQYAPAQTDPGHTYDRAVCDAAFERCPAGLGPGKQVEWCVAKQADWIRRMEPRDNVALVEDAPF